MRSGVAAAAKGSLGFSKRGHRAFRKQAGSVCRSVREQLGSAGLCWTRAAWDGSLAAAMTGLQSLVNEQDRNLLDGYNRVLAAIERAHLEGLKQPAEAPKTPKPPACSRGNPWVSKEAAGGADQPTIRCSVKIPQGRLLQLQMPRSANVKTLKGAISARTAIPTLEQKLVAGGKPLRDATQLGEASAGEELNVVVNFGLAGGAGGADAAGSRASAMEVSVSPRIRIRNYNTGETCTLRNPPRLCKDVLEHLDMTEGWGRGKLTETMEGEVISIPVNDQVPAGSYIFKEVQVAAGPGTGGALAPRRLSDSEVLSQLQHKYQAPVMAHIQDQSSSLSRRQEPIIPDANGVVEELGQCLNLEGYAVFALRALIGLLVLQSRSNKVKSGDSNRENQDDKFGCGTQILRIVGAPGTGKTTALTFLWRYVHDHLDELLAKLPGWDKLKISDLRERIQNSLRLDRFLCFTFSNAGLEKLLTEEEPAMTGAFMATRMLYAMLGGAGRVTYQTFLQQMDPALRLSLQPRHLMQFIQIAAGLGQKRGLVVFGFDECGAPRPETPGEPTYFQRGLSSLVPWRWEEANRRFDDGAAARDLLPVVIISGSHSARMNLLKTASGYARIYNLGRPILRDESLVSIAMDAVQRIAGATGTAVPGSAEEVLRVLTPWLGWNPRALVTTLCFAGAASTPKQVHVGRLWEFLQLPPEARLDKVYAVLEKVEDDLKASNWAVWLRKAGEKEREALFNHALAYSIIGRLVARVDRIPGGNQSWADAENDGFIGLTDYKHEIQWGSGLQAVEKDELSDPDSPPKPGRADGTGPSSTVTSARSSAINEDEGEAAPDSLAVAYVHIPPLLLRVMYQQLSAVWSTVRSLQQFPESWEDREQSDLGLLMLRLQLAGSVFGERTMQLEELCLGLSTLGEVFIPTGDYVIHRVNQQLKAPGFAKACLEKAQVGCYWAFMGPGNWGPDSWLILIRVDGEKIILYVQSKKRIMGALQYPEAALDKEAGKCWDVPGVQSSMLYLTDERGRDEDLSLIETSSDVTVVPVSRHARDVAYGVAMATVKRAREAIEQAGRGKKPKA